LNVNPPLQKHKAPPHKCKAPLSTTFWRRFWIKCYHKKAGTRVFARRYALPSLCVRNKNIQVVCYCKV